MFLRLFMLPSSLINDAEIIVQMISLYNSLDVRHHCHGFFSHPILFITYRQVHGRFHEKLSVIFFKLFFKRFLIETQSTVIIALFVQNHTNIEICFRKLLLIQYFQFVIFCGLVLFHTFLKVLQSQNKFLLLHIKTCQIEISFHIILIEFDTSRIYLNHGCQRI